MCFAKFQMQRSSSFFLGQLLEDEIWKIPLPSESTSFQVSTIVYNVLTTAEVHEIIHEQNDH